MCDESFRLIRASDLLLEEPPAEEVQVDQEGLVLNMHRDRPDLPRQEYFIERDRCRTYQDVLGWTLHLSGKAWVDRRLLREFIEKAIQLANLTRP